MAVSNTDTHARTCNHKQSQEEMWHVDRKCKGLGVFERQGGGVLYCYTKHMVESGFPNRL